MDYRLSYACVAGLLGQVTVKQLEENWLPVLLLAILQHASINSVVLSPPTAKFWLVPLNTLH